MYHSKYAHQMSSLSLSLSLSVYIKSNEIQTFHLQFSFCLDFCVVYVVYIQYTQNTDISRYFIIEYCQVLNGIRAVHYVEPKIQNSS